MSLIPSKRTTRISERGKEGSVMTCAGCVIRRRAVSVFRRERAQCRRSARWRRRPPGALVSAALGAWAAELVRMADRSPLAALAGAVAALILCSRRRIAPRWALAGAAAACAARLAPRRRPAARAGLDPVAPPGRPRARPPRTSAARCWTAWVCLGGALPARFAPRAEDGASTAPALATGLFLTSAGAAAQAVALGRIAGRVGLGTPEDTAVFVAVAAAGCCSPGASPSARCHSVPPFAPRRG